MMQQQHSAANSGFWRAAFVAAALFFFTKATQAQQPQQSYEPDLSALIKPTTERPSLIPPPSTGHLTKAPSYLDGGHTGMMRAIYKQLRFPAIGARICVEGYSWVSFDVGTDGNVYNARIVKSLQPDFDGEALKAVRALGKFAPGTDAANEQATITLTVPVLFKIQ